MFRRPSKQDGVTMIELLVSIAIFVAVASIVLFGFVGSRKHSDLRIAADVMANNLRRLQASAIAGQEINGAVPGGFGLSFDLSSTNNRLYRLFTDTYRYNGATCVAGTNQRNDYVLGGSCQTNEGQLPDSPVQLPGSVQVDTVYIGGIAVTSISQIKADIVFTTPEAVVHAHYGNSFNSYNPAVTGSYLPSPGTNQIIVICLKHTQLNQYRKVTILGATGQIDVGNAITTCTP